MSVVELKYKPVWGWVFDFCNTHWIWVLKKSDSKNRHSGRCFKKLKVMLEGAGSGIWFFDNHSYIPKLSTLEFFLVTVDMLGICVFWSPWLSTLIPGLMLVQFLIPAPLLPQKLWYEPTKFWQWKCGNSSYVVGPASNVPCIILSCWHVKAFAIIMRSVRLGFRV
jgi:hypothetical protein